MAALAGYNHFKFIAGGHHWPWRHAKGAERHARPVMHPIYGIHRTLGEQAVFHHLSGAAAAFFGRLKNQVHGAVEIALLRQILRGPEQHRHVAVMAASVHLAVMRGAVREGIRFLHRQCIHVGAQSDRTRAGSRLDGPDDAGLSQSAVDRDAPFRELLPSTH